MKNNTTLTATMAGRRHGKSMFGKNVTTAWTDEWETISTEKRAKEYLEFNTPPLALVVAMQEAGKDGPTIYSTLEGVGKHTRMNTGNVVTAEHLQHAAEIYDYFAKKHTMRRIKGEFVSKFMLAVDDLCENRKKIDVEHVKVLVSLPRIYKQNRAQERVIKGHKSAPKNDSLEWPAMEGELTFVDKLHIKTGQNNEWHYFWRTPNNYLMRVVMKKGHYGAEAWDVLAAHGKIHLSTDVTYTYPIKGYIFNVLQPSPERMEIKIV